MMRVLTVLVILAVGQFVLALALVHLGLILLAGMSWWAWSLVEGRRRG
ncbi:MAG TPA: hypothetical protein VGS21_02260 [Acidimicrobiales bacterium]|nr:hypothetical protein [Acidimicrobiales bacterium]